jgi:hypothetical protein
MEDSAAHTAMDVERTIQVAESAAMAARAVIGCQIDKDVAYKLHEDVLASLTGPDGSIPPEVRTATWNFDHYKYIYIRSISYFHHLHLVIPVPEDSGRKARVLQGGDSCVQ